jgi:hypothetical protein
MPACERDHAGRPFMAYEPTILRLAAEHGGRVQCVRKPIPDLGVPSVRYMIEILDTIDAARSIGECVYVHCWGGRGRTGTVLGCWLARHGECDPLGRLRGITAHAVQFFSRVPETRQQQAFVQTWETAQ